LAASAVNILSRQVFDLGEGDLNKDRPVSPSSECDNPKIMDNSTNSVDDHKSREIEMRVQEDRVLELEKDLVPFERQDLTMFNDGSTYTCQEISKVQDIMRGLEDEVKQLRSTSRKFVLREVRLYSYQSSVSC